jgi:transcriptional regulator with AAA-type ATPase domain/tetratricopeptide (TPR) repeat protein
MDLLARILGESPAIVELRQQVKKLLDRQTDSRRMVPILIEGATGTGKGLLAQALYAAGPRARGPFVDVNCAAIPATLLESEMFGVEKGAFTDARQSKPGLFQLAHRGTIFLDEIGLLPEALQAKLLKVIEERSVRRLGATRSEPVDVWVIAATNENLTQAIREGRFRADLYHRLAVVTLSLPPLCERGDDVVRLAHHFLARACTDYGLPAKTLSPDAVAAVKAHRWPGNVRELSNAMERAALLSEATVVTAKSLDLEDAPVAGARAEAPAPAGTLEAAIGDVEREHLLAALTDTGWNITRTALRLGISRNTLRYRMEKHGLRQAGTPPRRPAPARRVAVEAAKPSEPPVGDDEVRSRRRLTLLRLALTADDDVPRSSQTRVLDLAAEKIESFGGRLQQRDEHVLVAAFGLEPAEDGARRAATAARTIHNAVARGRAGEVSVRVVLTIHVADAVVRRGRGGIRVDPAPDDDAETVLEALAADAPAGAVVVSDAAAAFLDRRFDLMRVGAPGSGYRLIGPERSGLGVGLGGRMTAFVGRRHELELLHSRLQAAVRGRGQVVGIVGEAGIGKSRLLFEFRQALTQQPCVYLPSHCAPYGASMPYLPVIDLLRNLCGIVDGDAPESAVGKITGAVASVGMEADTASYLLHLLEIDRAAGATTAGMSPDVVKVRTFDALRQLTLRRSRTTPLIVVVEDLQWIDKTSEEYLTAFIDGVPAAAVLTIVTYRPGYRPPWLDKSYATQVALQPLAPEESRQVVESMLGRDDVPPAIFDAVVAKAEGNPFFLEELTRGLRDQEPATVTVPDTIQEVLLGRIDRLDPEDKRLLHVAAVIGRDVPWALLQAVSNTPADTLRARFQRLQAAEFLYENGIAAETGYTFKHSLIQEVIHASLLAEDRRALHAAIVTALETAHRGRLNEVVESLAHHAFSGEAWDKALTYLWQAGARAVSRSAHWEGVAFFEQALVALRHLPRDRARLEQGVDLRFDLRNALQPLGEFAPMLEHLREAESLAHALGDDRRLGRVHAYITDYYRLTGAPDRALASGLQAVAIAERLQDVPLTVSTQTWLGQVQYLFGRYREAAEFFTRNVELLRGDRARERFGMPQLPAVHSRTCLVWALAELGDFEDAVPLAREAVRLAEAADHPLSLLVARAGAGILHLMRGENAEAITELEQALELVRTWRTPLWLPRVASALGVAYARSGNTDPAMRLTDEAITRGVAMKVAGGQSLLFVHASEACLRGGAIDRARELARRALELAQSHTERGNEAWALRILGEVAAHGGPPERDAALASLGGALARAEELGMRPLAARCHRSLGRLHDEAGETERAQPHRARADALVAAMGMREA